MLDFMVKNLPQKADFNLQIIWFNFLLSLPAEIRWGFLLFANIYFFRYNMKVEITNKQTIEYFYQKAADRKNGPRNLKISDYNSDEKFKKILEPWQKKTGSLLIFGNI